MLGLCATAVPVRAQTPLTVELVADGFASPVLVLSTPARSDERLFVVERVGRIRVLVGGATLPMPFLDLTAKVKSLASGGQGEQGLLLAMTITVDGQMYLSDFTEVTAYWSDVGTSSGVLEGKVRSVPSGEETLSFRLTYQDFPQEPAWEETYASCWR